MLLEKYADPSGVPYLNPSIQDAEGNSLFHMAIKNGTKNLSLEAVKLLSKHKVNPRLPNKEGEVPLQMVKRNDRRYPFLTQAASHHLKPKPSGGGKGDNAALTTQGGVTTAMPQGGGAAQQMMGDDGIRVGDAASSKQQQSGMAPTGASWKEQTKREIACLIDVLPPYVAKRPRLVEDGHVALPIEEVAKGQASGGARVEELPKEIQGTQIVLRFKFLKLNFYILVVDSF